MPPPTVSTIAGLVVVRGEGIPMVQRRLPRRAPASVGRRERFALELQPQWVPRDLGTFTPVDDGWLFTNSSRALMRLESELVLTGSAGFRPQAMVMLQRGDHRITWEGLERPLAVSVTVRTRRLDDQRMPYVLDSALDTNVDGRQGGAGSYLGVTDAPMSAVLRHRLAVLYRHLIEGEPEPRNLLASRASALGISEEELQRTAHRCRRRLNVVRALDLQSLEELGEYLVLKNDELARDDLDP